MPQFVLGGKIRARVMNKIDFVLAGVGGQGIILMSDLLAETALSAGFDVKKSDVHGMAQRGGSVVSYVRVGERVLSPLPRAGEVDYLVGLEKLEVARWSAVLGRGGVAVVNDHAILPLSVSAGAERYPTDAEVDGRLRERTDRVYWVDGAGIATRLGNPKAMNVVVLGFLAGMLPIPWQCWVDTLTRKVPSRYRELNLKALETGRRASEALASGR